MFTKQSKTKPKSSILNLFRTTKTESHKKKVNIQLVK